jgi:hypothetical protein
MALLMFLSVETASAFRKPFAKSGAFHRVAPVKALDHMERSTPLNGGCDIIVWPIMAGGLLIQAGAAAF